MSNCCSHPASAAAATPPADPARKICPRCGQAGKGVSLLTLKHQVKPAHLAAVEAGPFVFCRSAECPVVYFNAIGTTLLLADVRQVPTVKKSGNPQLCYCFGFDTDMVREEIAATGVSTIPQRIATEMKAGRCACEIRNPQGSCCFANVSAVVKRELSAVHSAPAIG